MSTDLTGAKANATGQAGGFRANSQGRRFTTLFAALLLVAVSASGTAVAYNDDPPSDPNCQVATFCVYGSAYYGGDRFYPVNSNPDWPCCGSQGVQNDDDSVWNRHGIKGYVYMGNAYVGFVYCVEPGIADENILNSIDNVGNSHQLISGTSCGGLQKP